MACHEHGMRRFTDSIRQGSAVTGQARLKVQQLFPEQSQMTRLLDEDELRYLTAFEKAAGPFLKTGTDADKPIKSFKEPVGEIARQYQSDLRLEEVAVELGLSDPARLLAALKATRALTNLGLAPLAEGAAIKRSTWSEFRSQFSLFHEAAKELDIGEPVRKR